MGAEDEGRRDRWVMHGTIPLGTLAGIPVRVQWSVLAIFGLLTWTLATEALPASDPEVPTAAAWALAAGCAVVFLAGLLAHELSHSFVARRSGVNVAGITLWLFGGVAQIDGELPTARAELRTALAGPAMSMALGAGYLALAGAMAAGGVPDAVVAALVWLGSINVVLAVFNLLPGAPLDGGRVLRAWLWRRSGDRLGSARQAGRAGQVVAYFLVGLGVLELASGLPGGLWLMFIGWFLLNAARREELDATLRADLSGVTVEAVMTRDPLTVPHDMSAAALVDDFLLRHRSAFPVVRDGRVVGLVTLDQVRRVPRGEWGSRTVAEVASPLDGVTMASPRELLLDALGRVPPTGGGRIVVMDGGRLVGIVTSTDVARVVRAAEALR